MAIESYFMGVDVGTGSARVCIIDSSGIILAVESKEIKTWNTRADYYVPDPFARGNFVRECVLTRKTLGAINRRHLGGDLSL